MRHCRNFSAPRSTTLVLAIPLSAFFIRCDLVNVLSSSLTADDSPHVHEQPHKPVPLARLSANVSSPSPSIVNCGKISGGIIYGCMESSRFIHSHKQFTTQDHHLTQLCPWNAEKLCTTGCAFLVSFGSYSHVKATPLPQFLAQFLL